MWPSWSACFNICSDRSLSRIWYSVRVVRGYGRRLVARRSLRWILNYLTSFAGWLTLSNATRAQTSGRSAGEQLSHIQKSQLRWFQYLLMLRVGDPRVAPEHARRITVYIPSCVGPHRDPQEEAEEVTGVQRDWDLQKIKDGCSDRKTVSAWIWPAPDTFIWPTYLLEWWHWVKAKALWCPSDERQSTLSMKEESQGWRAFYWIQSVSHVFSTLPLCSVWAISK